MRTHVYRLFPACLGGRFARVSLAAQSFCGLFPTDGPPQAGFSLCVRVCGCICSAAGHRRTSAVRGGGCCRKIVEKYIYIYIHSMFDVSPCALGTLLSRFYSVFLLFQLHVPPASSYFLLG